jgi:hypothetical protein
VSAAATHSTTASLPGRTNADSSQLRPSRVRWSDRLSARIGRLTHWEFWPAAVVYAPFVPYLGWLALRHGGLGVCAACNPSFPASSVLRESKADILRAIPEECSLPFVPIARGPLETRLRAVREFVDRGTVAWPIVLKPDQGERGTGVRVVHDADQAREHVEAHPEPLIAQAHHPGPFEAGVFYIRDPNSRAGRIFSITDKGFSHLVSDGRSTLRELIWRHPRLRFQARAHLAALQSPAETIAPAGAVIPLSPLGNHCRGTLFRDGTHLITPALTDAFDGLARRIEGFHFGRFDVRYADPAEFALGRGFRVIELNGLLSESTNMYDPSIGFWRAQRILRMHWKLAYEIGAANARNGVAHPTLRGAIHIIHDALSGRDERRHAGD